MYDQPPEPPEPEDDPEGYSDYLRRVIVGAARALCAENGFSNLKKRNSLSTISATIEDLAETVQTFDSWNEEFKLGRTD